ncbi:MAG: L,D-transpeptidase family protein [Verrucomicrobiota bacterium]
MKRFGWLVLPGMAGVLGFFLVCWWNLGKAERLIPGSLRRAVPEDCRQLVVVRPGGLDASTAEVWLLQRAPDVYPWKIAAGPMPAVVGRNGVGWGLGEPELPNPGGYTDKKEGDGRSPAGIFRLPGAFGTAPQAPDGTRLSWQECTSTLRGVDDVKSKYYNRIVDEAAVPDKDWDSAETMRREDGLYEMGVMIGHNPDRVAGGGSCIFLHVWKGPGQGTAGCTALEVENVRKIIAWLDPGMAPRLVLGVPGQ